MRSPIPLHLCLSASLCVAIVGNAHQASAQEAPPVVVTNQPKITTAQSLSVGVSVGTDCPTCPDWPFGWVELTAGSYDSGEVVLGAGDGEGTLSAGFVIPAGSLPVGNDTLTVVYTPDSFEAAAGYLSSSGTSTVDVTSGGPTVTVVPLSSAIVILQALQVDVTVSGGTGKPTPTGSVVLTSGSYTSGATALSNGSATIAISGGSLAIGSDILKAVYTPDSASSGTYTSASGTGKVVVRASSNSVTTTTTLAVTSGGSSVTTVNSGSVVTLTATVLAGSTPVTPGRVNFCNAAASNCIGLNLLATAQLTSAGTATYKFRPGIGSHSYYAVFAGTPNGATAYAGSTSSTEALAVTGMWPSITTLAASPETTSGTYNLTATVGGNGSAAPTGTVSFLDANNGNSVLGSATLGAGAAGTSFLNVTNSALNAAVAAPLSIAAGDFNGDGIPDLAMVNTECTSECASYVSILLGKGDGTFTTGSPIEIGVGAATYIAIADFNGDGILDLAFAQNNGQSGAVIVLLGNGDGTFTATGTSYGTGDEPSSIAVADFNGDGVPDLAVANYESNSVTILLGNGDGTFTTGETLPTGSFPNSIVEADFNGDGIPDLAVDSDSSPDSNSMLTILLGNGDGTFTATTTSPATGLDPDSVAVGDFNGDGIPDLAVANVCGDDPRCESGGTISILTGNGDGSFTATATSPQTGPHPGSIAVGDFNGNGVADLVVANSGDDTLMLLSGNGDGTFSTAATTTTAAGLSGVVAADFNGDGVSDVAVFADGDEPGVFSFLTANETATGTGTVTLPPGTEIHQVDASYPGDSNYSASISGTVALANITPTVTVTPSSSSIAETQALTVSVVVNGPSGDPTPTGSVTLTSGGYTSAAATLSSGSAAINIPAGSLALGSDTLTVNYTPDTSSTDLYASASGTSAVVVTLPAPTVRVTPSLSGIWTTQPLQVNVEIPGPGGERTPTGSITLTGGGYTSAATVLNNGLGQINVPPGSLTPGIDTLTVTYSPDSVSSTTYTSSSGTTTVVVDIVKPVVTVQASSIPPTVALTVGVTVSGLPGESIPTPTGSVTLTSGGYTSAATVLSGGIAWIVVPAGTLALGTDPLTVNYVPDSASATVYASAEGGNTVDVALATPAVTVTPLSTTILTSQALQVNVTVSSLSGYPTPTGTAELTSGSYDSGAITLNSGSVTINIPAGSLSPHTKTLTVAYVPDSASSSTYSGATGTATVTLATTTTLAITSSGSAASTVSSGSVVTLTATVLTGTTPVTVGQVKFCDATATYCEDVHNVGTAQLTSAGTATYKFRPAVGSHSYKAVFLGTPYGTTAYAASTSSTAALAVTGLWPSITTISLSPGTSSNTYDFTATVGGNGSAAPTGSVSFLDASNGNSVLGSATLGTGAAGVSFLNTSNPGSSSQGIVEIFGAVSEAVGDFNGDGIPDLAVVSQDDDSVKVLLGNGDGTFTPTAASPTVGSAPQSIAMGDFNGDGILDLATTNYNDNTVTVLLGNGDGTFTPTATSLATDIGPTSIVAGDFNGDGIPDLVVMNLCGSDPYCGSGGTLTILLGNGDGTFTSAYAPGAYTYGGYFSTSMVEGDFNGDGIPDLAVYSQCGYDPTCSSGSTVTVSVGNGKGAFTWWSNTDVGGSLPGSIAVGDFNGDGIPDLAITSSGGGGVLLGGGNGTFTPMRNLTTGSDFTAIAVGDFNGDGIPDLAVANYEDDSVNILIGDGTGKFATIAAPPYAIDPGSVVAGDFNGDGISDLAVKSFNEGSSVTILEGVNQTATATINGVAPAAPSDIFFEASYPGDSSYSGSTSMVTSPSGAQATPTVAVTPSASSITTFQALTVTVAVSGGSDSPAATGSVTLTSGSYTSSAITLTGGAAVINIPAGALAVGTDTVTATYTPDGNSPYYTSASGASTVVVAIGSAVAPTVTVTPLTTSILTTQVLQVNVAVSGPSGYAIPTGSVTLTGGGYTSGGTALSGGRGQINVPAGVLAVGSDSLTVTYTPDSGSSAIYTAASGANTILVTPNPLLSATVSVAPTATNIAAAQALQVNVTVNGPSGDPAPTGSVTLTGGGYTSAATTLSGGAAAINIPAGSLAAGSDTLTVNYTPDSASSVFYTSSSGASMVTVSEYSATVTVTPLSTSILTTQSLQVNVAVSGPSGDATPTGSVTLASGSYSSGAVTLSGGTAAINIPANSLSAGSDTLTASYTPDSTSSSTYANATGSATVTVTAPNPLPAIGSMSPAVETAGDDTFTLTVNGSDFTSGSVVYWGTSALTTTFVSAAQLTASVPASDIASSGTNSVSVQNPSPGGGTSNVLQFEVDSSGSGSPSFAQNTATVTPGQSAIYSVTLPNTASAVTASCLNLPSGASCSYSSSANTVTIATASSTPSGSFQVTVVFAETVAGAASSFIFAPILLTPLLLLRKKSTAGKIWFTACLGLVLLVASVGIGCGGGSSSGPPPPPPTHQVTTSGVVTLKVQ